MYFSYTVIMISFFFFFFFFFFFQIKKKIVVGDGGYSKSFDLLDMFYVYLLILLAKGCSNKPTALLKRGKMIPPSLTRLICWTWVVTHNAWGQDPGDCLIHELATDLQHSTLTLQWTRWAVGESWSDQSAGHVKP